MDLDQIKKKIATSKSFRVHLALSSFYWFVHIYFAHYVKSETADFQKEMCADLQDPDIDFLEIIGFRGCAKSTLAVSALPIYAMISNMSKFTLLVGDTFSQSKLKIYNIKNELESNELLKSDFGPFEANDEWTKTDIVIPKYDARITGRSSGQKVRGIIHKQYRPQLIIVDDPENIESVRFQEQRNLTYNWFVGEILPLTDDDYSIEEGHQKEFVKRVLIGNLLHADCLVARIKKDIEAGVRDGLCREYPIQKEDGTILWPGKYPNEEAIEKKRKTVGDLRTWLREYMLKIVPEEGQVIKDEDIHYYDALPTPREATHTFSATGVDLAISIKASADETAMVSGKVFHHDEEVKIYIMPNIVHARMGFHDTIKTAIAVSKSVSGNGELTQMFVENVAYQKSAIEEMQRKMLPVEGISPGGQDKRARLITISNMIKTGQVLFPRTGAEALITQLVGFGSEAHDDISDALVILLQGIMKWGLDDDEMMWSE